MLFEFRFAFVFCVTACSLWPFDGSVAIWLEIWCFWFHRGSLNGNDICHRSGASTCGLEKWFSGLICDAGKASAHNWDWIDSMMILLTIDK